MNDFKERLAELIKIAGSRRAAARLMGVSDVSIMAWLGGQLPLDSKLRTIAARIGVSEEWLRNGRGNADEQLAAFRAYYSGAPSPRARLLRAIELSGMTHAELAKKIGYDSGAVERALTGGRASERMIEAICRVVPNLDKHDLLGGSDDVPVIAEDGMTGNHGAKPRIMLPPGMDGFFAPLLSFAQAGRYNTACVDEDWNGESVLVQGIKDRRSFGLKIEGDSMVPQVNPGDVVIAVPSMQLMRGDTVVVKTTEDEVYCKIWGGERNGEVVLKSQNPMHNDIVLPRDQIAFVYPVAQVIKTLRR